MIERFMNTEGPVFRILEKIGQLVVLSLLWIVGCLPVVTITTSTTALYYGTMKTVRRDRGTATSEFFRSYKANLSRGILTTVVTLALGGVFAWNFYILYRSGNLTGNPLAGLYVIGMIVLMGIWIYTGPVLSRFTMNALSAWKLSFLMAVRFLPFTIVLLLGTIGLVLLQIFVLPMATALLLPSAWCYVTTFLVEKALRKYMPPKEENDDAWYYE